jgi:hypothetical protein
MFKIIRDFVKQPSFFVVCDRPCATYATVALPELAEFSDNLQLAFAETLRQQGWRISFAEHVCPMHVKKEAEGQSMIVRPDLHIPGVRH